MVLFTIAIAHDEGIAIYHFKYSRAARGLLARSKTLDSWDPVGTIGYDLR